MKKWILFNLVLLLAGAAHAQVQVIAGQSQSVGFPSASQALRAPTLRAPARTPASSKAVAKITNDDEIASEMDAANASAQATYRKQQPRVEYQAPAPQPRAQYLAPPPPAPQPRAQYHAPAPAPRLAKPVARQSVQTQPIYQQAYAEQPRAQVAPAPAPRPAYQAQPIQLNPPQTQVQQFPENQGNYPAEQDWQPVRRTGMTLLPTLNFGFGMTSADYITDSVTGISVTKQTKFIYGGGLMAEFGRSTLTFETGLLYLTEAINASYTTNVFNITSDNATLGYMGIPILAKLNLSIVPHRSRLNFSAGVIPAVLVYSKFDYVTTGNGLQRDVSDPNDAGLGLGGFRTFNVFGTAAIGGDLTVGPQADVRAELAYRRALMSLTQNQNTFEDVFLLNLSFGFDVGFFTQP